MKDGLTRINWKDSLLFRTGKCDRKDDVDTIMNMTRIVHSQDAGFLADICSSSSYSFIFQLLFGK